MVLSGVDWKNQPRTLLDWVTVIVALVLISIYFSQWWIEEGARHYGIWVFFVAWLIIYFTDYWQPILYILTALALAVITGFLLLGGFKEQPLDQAAILLTAIFLLLLVYLFFSEEEPQ